jgi:hypothetical protein
MRRLNLAYESGLLRKPIIFNTISAYLEKPELSPILGSVRKVLQKPLRWRSWYAGDEAITGSFGEDAHHDQEAG